MTRNLAAVVRDWITPQGGWLACPDCGIHRARGWVRLAEHKAQQHPEIAAEERWAS